MEHAEHTDAAFLRDAARYFENRSAGGEDMAHWSNVYNAKNCREIADRIEATRTNDQAKDEEIAELVGALAELWRVIDIAGLSNLAKGVQLGQVSWFVKASDAVEQARATLAKHQDKSRG